MLSKNFSLILLVTAIGLLAGNANAVDTRLPNLGSSAGQVAPRCRDGEQRQYGFYVLHELRNQNGVLDDALVADWLNTLGYRLVANSPQPDQAFTFFVVRDNDINAFALPGGFVGVNAGLITTTESESELAAVFAHEISHITQNHLIRAVEAEEKMTPLMILAMIGALAATAHQSPYNTSNSDVGAIAAVQGLAAQMQINFTRQDETEADNVGINTLAKSGFDPDAMAGFFERMQRALRPGFDENDVPALLMDHPVTTARISEAKARAEVIKKEYKPEVIVGDVEEAANAPAQTPAAGSKSDPKNTPTATGDAPISSLALLPKISPATNANLTRLLDSPQSRLRQRERAQAYYLLMRERVRVLASAHPNEMISLLRRQPARSFRLQHVGQPLRLMPWPWSRAASAGQAIDALQKLADAEPENLVSRLPWAMRNCCPGARRGFLQRYARAEKSILYRNRARSRSRMPMRWSSTATRPLANRPRNCCARSCRRTTRIQTCRSASRAPASWPAIACAQARRMPLRPISMAVPRMR